MLCTRCTRAKPELPSEVKVEIGGKVVDITEELRSLWRGMMDRGYPVVVFCEALNVVKVGDPASPARSVTECEMFTPS